MPQGAQQQNVNRQHTAIAAGLTQFSEHLRPFFRANMGYDLTWHGQFPPANSLFQLPYLREKLVCANVLWFDLAKQACISGSAGSICGPWVVQVKLLFGS